MGGWAEVKKLREKKVPMKGDERILGDRKEWFQNISGLKVDDFFDLFDDILLLDRFNSAQVSKALNIHFAKADSNKYFNHFFLCG